MDFTLTQAAARFIARILRFDGKPGSGFRLRVTAGGCSGLAAEFDVESAPRPGDEIVENSGITFFLPAESRMLLDQVTIDFVETPTQTGFVFYDPKAGACGCGSPGTAAAGAVNVP